MCRTRWSVAVIVSVHTLTTRSHANLLVANGNIRVAQIPECCHGGNTDCRRAARLAGRPASEPGHTCRIAFLCGFRACSSSATFGAPKLADGWAPPHHNNFLRVVAVGAFAEPLPELVCACCRFSFRWLAPSFFSVCSHASSWFELLLLVLLLELLSSNWLLLLLLLDVEPLL